jgi:hypothetical protein
MRLLEHLHCRETQVFFNLFKLHKSPLRLIFFEKKIIFLNSTGKIDSNGHIINRFTDKFFFQIFRFGY